MFVPVVKDAVLHRAEDLGPAVVRGGPDSAGAPRRVRLPGGAHRPAGRRRRRGRRAPHVRPGRPATGATEDALRAVELLQPARPLVWAGGGALQAGAGEAVARLAERLVAPVLLTYSAHGLLPPGPSHARGRPPTCPRWARSGTKPTWWWRWAAISTA